MRPRTATALLALLLGGAQAPAEVWQGALSCDNLPGFTTIPLREPIEIDVAGGVAHYERFVRQADTSISTPVREAGQGPVGTDGTVQLRGGASAPNYQYTSQYSGRLPRTGGPAQFSGNQR